MVMETDLQYQTINDTPLLPGVEYDANGKPVGSTLEEWIDKLDRKLVAHYGEDFRIMLNESRIERGMSAL
jgi:hypothetical protein